MGSGKAPSESPPDDDSPPAPPSGSGSKSSPAPEKSSARSPPPPDDSSPPPPSPKKSPPPPDKSSPPPPDEASPPPPSPKKSPPPAQSPPPSSPPPENASPPPSSSPPPPSKANKSPPATTPSAPKQKPTPSPPAQTSPPADGKKSPAPPVDGVDTETPPAPTGDTVNSPAGKAFVAPAPAIASNQSATSGRSSGSSGSKGGSSSSHAGAIAGGVIGGVLFVMFVVCIWMFCRRKKKQQKNYNQIWNHSPSPDHKHHAINIPPGGPGWQPSSSPGYLPPRPPPGASDGAYSPYYPNRPTPAAGSMLPAFSPEIGGSMNPNHLAYEDLVAATDGFANANMLGQGGFGYVHKGVLPGGKEVAVKCLKSGSGQGEREFQAEVDIISRVHHRHLVSLVGYSIANEKRLLVYEYVPNNTLEYHLHKSRNTPLDFSTRVRIALGSAKGLAYLHEDCHPRIIHRDIKAANILLDYNFEAQVADFGLARLSNDANTHVSTRVMGTFGYLAPEYASSGKLTDKSDVFSFGVVLLELITGRRPIDPNDQSMEDDSLVDWARPLLSKAVSDGVYDELVDRRLEGNYNPQEMTNMVACAAASIRHSAKRRPRMSQIVRTLEGDMSGLDGTRTGLSTPAGSTDYDTAAYNADMKKFRQMAFGTLELDGGSTATTGEFDLNHSSSTSVASSNANSPRKT